MCGSFAYDLPITDALDNAQEAVHWLRQAERDDWYLRLFLSLLQTKYDFMID